MSPDNVTPISGNPDQERKKADRREKLELSAYLMGQAVQAAILLITEDDQPEIACDVLRLARDRWSATWEAHIGEEQPSR